jgi:hypothetical protein
LVLILKIILQVDYNPLSSLLTSSLSGQTEDGKPAFYGDITITGGTATIGNAGVLYYPSGEIFYWGGFRNGELDGTGTYYDEDGTVPATE